MNIFDIYYWYNCNCPPGSPNFAKIISDWVSEKAFLDRIFELPIFKFFQKIIMKCPIYQEIQANRAKRTSSTRILSE